MAEIFGVALAGLATGTLLSRFNALALLVGGVLFSGGTITVSLMIRSSRLHPLLLGLAAALAVQIGYLAGLTLWRRSRK
jgi:hypothetical protein